MIEEQPERWGIFTPRQIDDLAGELRAGDNPNELPPEREERARTIIARRLRAAARDDPE